MPSHDEVPQNGHGDPERIAAFDAFDAFELDRWERVAQQLSDFVMDAPFVPLNGIVQQHYHLPRTQGAAAAASGELIELDTYELLTTEPPRLLWLADGVWARGAMTMFGGREKCGKSLVQLVLAAAVASGGRRVAGIDCRPGRVLLVDAENGRREIHRRLKSIGLGAEHADAITVIEARGFDLGQDFDQLVGAIDRHQPDVVILDSFRSLWRGDERDEAACAGALYPLSQLAQDREIAVSLTHHAQKNGGEYRGSTAIGAVPDWVVMLSRQAGDEDKTRRKLSTPMCRIDAEREDRWLTIDKTFTGVELRVAGEYRQAKPRDEKAQAVLDVLTGDEQSGREIARQTGISEPTVRRVLCDLKDQGLTEQRPGGWRASSASSLKTGDAGDAPQEQLATDEEEALAARLFEERDR